MPSRSRFALLLAVCSLCALAHRAGAAPDPDVKVVQAFLQARLAATQLTATAAEVDAALALCSDDVVYEHAAFGARVEGRAAQREGMASHLGQTRNARMNVAILHTANHVVVARVTQRWEVKDGEAWKKGGRENVTAFKVDAGKITHIWDF